MKGMASAQEFQQAPPPGTYWSVIATAESSFARSGASMIKVTPTIDDQRYPAFKDLSCDDYIITDGGAKGGGMGKTKLRGLGLDVDSSDAELADEAICAQLQGRGVWVTYGNEQRMTRNGEEGPYDIPMTVVDSKTGAVIKLMKLVVKGYALHNVGQAQTAPAPARQQAPAGAPYAQPGQQAAPQQFVQQNPLPNQQFAPPTGQPQFQQAPQPGFQSAPGFAQPPHAGMQPAFQQPGQPPAQQMQQAAPPWAGQPQPNGAPPPASAKPRGRKLAVPNEDPNAGQPQG